MALAGNGAGEAIEIRVPCKPEYVRTIRRTVAEFAESINMSKSAIEEVEVAASEAVTNVVRHAYMGCNGRIPPMRVKCSHRKGTLIVEVFDKGCGFDAPPTSVVPEVDLNRDGGLGIILIKCLMDRVNFVSKPSMGTRIRMTKHAREAMKEAVRSRHSGSKLQAP